MICILGDVRTTELQGEAKPDTNPILYPCAIIVNNNLILWTFNTQRHH